MTNRLKLLAAVAAIVLPAGIASAQSVAPGGGAARPATRAVTPPVQTPPTANTATEDAQAATEATTSATTGQPPAQAAPQANASAQTSVQTNAQTATAAPVRLATAADLRAGVQVRDPSGGVVGTVESADATGAVVSTGRVRARLALASFGANGQALVISMTRAQLEAAASQAAPRPRAG